MTGTATDAAGNTASATVADIFIDITAPEITATATIADGQLYDSGDWTDQPVTVTYLCSDALSDVAVCPAAQTFGESAGQRATGTAFDLAGNSASTTLGLINIDMTAPTIVASTTMADGQAYTPGTWANQTVTVTFLCRDGSSNIGACTAPQTFSEGANQRVTGTAIDAAGNRASATVENINIDATVPSIVGTAMTADGAVYISGRWTNQPVTVTFSCGDTASGLAVPCPAPVVIDSSTALEGQAVSAQVADLAGNTATSNAILVMVDRDAPQFVSMPGDLLAEATGETGTVVTWSAPSATDAVVGTIAPVCGPHSGWSFPLGVTTVTCTATDPVGNAATASFTVSVGDTHPPVLTVPGDITAPADSPSGAVVTYNVSSSEISAASSVACAPLAGSRFPIGKTTVTCHASDAYDNRATASFTITVMGAADLLPDLRANTMTLVTNRTTERMLLLPLDQAQKALKTRNTFRAYLSLLQYRLMLDWYARTGQVPPTAVQQLHTGADQVLDAMR